MADQSSVSPPIENKYDMVEVLSRGCKPKADWRIGTEHEKFVFYKDTHKPVPYGGENGIRALLEATMAANEWTPLMDGGALIGLKDPAGSGAVSLEPGGQFELSGATLETVHQTCAETADQIGRAHV